MQAGPTRILANASAMTIAMAAAMLVCLTAAPVAQSAGIDLSTGEPYRVGLSTKNNAWRVTITVPLFYSNPLGGDYQPYVGGTYHATEMFNFMGDIYMHTAGLKIHGYDELSDTMKARIEENYPIYRAPPPVDDARRNVTSWSYFRSLMEQRREAREETESRY